MNNMINKLTILPVKATVAKQLMRRFQLLNSAATFVVFTYLAGAFSGVSVYAESSTLSRSPVESLLPISDSQKHSLVLANGALTKLNKALNRLQVSIADNKNKSRLSMFSEELQEVADNWAELSRLDSRVLAYYDDRIAAYQKFSTKAVTHISGQKRSYRASLKALKQHIDELSLSSDVKALKLHTNKAQVLVTTLKHKPTHTAWDQQALPFGPNSNGVRAPALEESSLYNTLGIVATNSLAEPNSLDLEFNLDVPLSTDIQTLADSLNGDPVAIYNWVYNNVDFVPSYGSLQGGDFTLQIQRGNATDISSLLIALLRASGVEARYKYGTVEIPVEKAMNWLGGVEAPAAARNLLVQGGIPTVLMMLDGKPESIRIEHTWVTMWDGDNWVDIDPSLKQYVYHEGMDIESSVPFDIGALISNLSKTSIINEQDRSIQNLDTEFLALELNNYLDRLKLFSGNIDPQISVTDYIGGQSIIERTDLSLPLVRPYTHVNAEISFREIPEDLKHKYSISMKSSTGDLMFRHEVYTTEIAGEFIALSFSATTDEDFNTFFNLIPIELNILDDLPEEIPVGIFNVSPVLVVGDKKLPFSSSLGIGVEAIIEKGFKTPQQDWTTKGNPIIAGEYQAIGVSFHGVSQKQFGQLLAKIDDVGMSLSRGENSVLGEQNVFGVILQSALLNYFSEVHAKTELYGRAFGVVTHPQPSYGTFSTSAAVTYNFGVPESYRLNSFLMDIDNFNVSSECKANCWNKWYQFNRDIGALASAYEHDIPERYFDSLPGHVYGSSTVKALHVAFEEGQKVFSIDDNNWATVKPQLNMDANIFREIESSVATGANILIHQNSVDIAGWEGVGYMLIDPDTGSAAYKISGGANGGVLKVDMNVDFSSGSKRCPYPKKINKDVYSSKHATFTASITVDSRYGTELGKIFGIAADMISEIFPKFDSKGNQVSKGSLSPSLKKAGELSKAIEDFVYKSEVGKQIPLVEQEYLLLAANSAKALKAVMTPLVKARTRQVSTRAASLFTGAVIGAFIAPYLYAVMVNHCRK